MNEQTEFALDFKKAGGLIPAIVQDDATGDVLIDQLVQMQRTGFDVAVLAEGVDASAAQPAKGTPSDPLQQIAELTGLLGAVAFFPDAAREGRIRLRHQLLIYPVTQCVGATPSREKFAEGYFLTRESMDWFDGFYMPPGADRQDERASPLLTPPPEGLAPALVITAGFDPLLDEGRDYAKLLKDAGVACDRVDYDDQIHGFFSFTAFSNRAEGAIEDAARTVRQALT